VCKKESGSSLPGTQVVMNCGVFFVIVSQVPTPGMTMEKTAAAMICRSSIPLLGVSSSSSKTMLGTMGGGARENIFTASCLAVSLGGGLGGTTLGSRAQRSCRSSRRTCGSSDGIAEMRLNKALQFICKLQLLRAPLRSTRCPKRALALLLSRPPAGWLLPVSGQAC
jgi:hypothetical protein